MPARVEERPDPIPSICSPYSAVATFLALVSLTSLPFWLLIALAGRVSAGGGHYLELLMWAPATAALLTCRLKGIPVGSLGLGVFPIRYAALGYLLPITYGVLAYTTIWATGLASFPDALEVQTVTRDLGWSTAPASVFILEYGVLLGLAGMIGGTARALGEEIGWRGLLLPLLLKRLGLLPASLASGLIWAAWHLPLLLLADYHGAAPWWYSLTCFCALTIGVGFVLAWLRLRSRSVWPCAILHASHNLYLHGILTRFTTAKSVTAGYVLDEFGAAVPIAVGVVAILIWNWERTRAEATAAAAHRRQDRAVTPGAAQSQRENHA